MDLIKKLYAKNMVWLSNSEQNKYIDYDLKIISVKNFYNVNFLQRRKINASLEKNHMDWLTREDRDYKIFNFPLKLDHTLFFQEVHEKFLELCREYFGDFKILEDKKYPYCYRSKRDDFRSVLHDHVATSTVSGVYYYQIKGKDGIVFKDNKSREYIQLREYNPQQGELLLFPSNLVHKPVVTKSRGIRYSFNLEIQTEESTEELFKNYELS